MEEFVVYVLYSARFNKIYIGFSSDLINRMKAHNIFDKTGYPSRYRPWIVVYIEFYATKPEAMKREKQLKSAQGRKFIHEQIFFKR
jgi:putative endonuclease